MKSVAQSNNAQYGDCAVSKITAIEAISRRIL
jgi:hypothetical protein